MKRSIKVSAVLASTVGTLCVGVYALFHGYFDTGQFDVKQMQWSSSGKFATLAERSDNQALGGLTYFVVTGNHLLSPDELKRAYHSNAVIFAASSTCLDLRWQGPSELVIECHGPYLKQEYIDTEETQSGEVTITYVNISPDTSKTFSPNNSKCPALPIHPDWASPSKDIAAPLGPVSI